MKRLLVAVTGLFSLGLLACGSGSERTPEKLVTIVPLTAVATSTPIPTATLPAVLPTPRVIGIDGEVNSLAAGVACQRPGVLTGEVQVIWNSQNICIVRYLRVGTIQGEVPFANDIAEYRRFKEIGDQAIQALISDEACNVAWGPPVNLNRETTRKDLVVSGC